MRFYLVRAMSDTTQKTILLVDDLMLIILGMEAALKPKNYHIVKAFDGLEALEKFKDEPIDLLITDVQMPNMGGRELAQIVQRDYPKTKIIVQSAFAEKEELDIPFIHGADVTIQKSFSEEELLNAVENLLKD